MQTKTASFGPLIVILRPADPSAGSVFDIIQVDSNCCFRAHGDVDRTRVQQILTVEGKVQATGCPSVTKAGQVDTQFTWHIDDLGPCNVLDTAQPNQLKVKMTYKDSDGATQTSLFETQPFRAVGSYYNCYYYATTRGGSAPAAISQLLPRYYRIACRFKGGDTDFGLLGGGLIQSNDAYLAYDPNLSTPYSAVWRSASHFEITGNWTLRVESTPCCTTAELWLQSVKGNQVRVPLVFSTPSWNSRGLSVFAPKSDIVHHDPFLAQAVLEVEPA